MFIKPLRKDFKDAFALVTVDALRAGISFFSTLNAGGNFDSLRGNLYIIPVTGAVIGIFIAVPAVLLAVINAGFLVILIYLAVEGINHVDGLSDFFDAVFAPPARKLEALKDINSGTGGNVAITIYIIMLTVFFSKVGVYEIFFTILVSQILAKQAMLQLMLSLNPLWDGMASEFTKYRKNRDYYSYIFTLSVLGLTGFQYPYQVIGSAMVYLLITFGFIRYIRKRFGGINGDMIGALNCMVFAAVIGVWACLQL